MLRLIRVWAFSVSVLLLAGIVSLMALAAGKNEDIAGIVAPALLLALLSGTVATATALLEKRPRRDE